MSAEKFARDEQSKNDAAARLQQALIDQRIKELEAGFSTAAEARTATYRHEFETYKEVWRTASTVIAYFGYAAKSDDHDSVDNYRDATAEYCKLVSCSAPFLTDSVNRHGKELADIVATGFTILHSSGNFQRYAKECADRVQAAADALETAIRERLKTITTIANEK